MDPVTVNCTIIDWCEVTAILFDTFMVACFTVLFGAIAALGVNWYRRRQYQRQEDVLLELAVLRSKGVALRKERLKKPANKDKDAHRAWLVRVEAWKEELETTAKLFSPVEAERLKTGGWITLLGRKEYPDLKDLNDDEIKDVSQLSETLERLDRMLEQRFRPTQSP